MEKFVFCPQNTHKRGIFETHSRKNVAQLFWNRFIFEALSVAVFQCECSFWVSFVILLYERIFFFEDRLF